MNINSEKHLRILERQYPTIREVSTEIINLQSILSLPKGTEHFLSDIHGEYEQFSHVLKNGSGTVRRKIDEVFGNELTERQKRSLATLVYYPNEKLAITKNEELRMNDWYNVALHRLIRILKNVSSKYTRSKVRKAIPKGFIYVVEELITEKEEISDKEAYYNEIIQTIIRIGDAEEFIQTLCNLIQRLVIDHLHIVGDIYDRGPGPHLIMDTLYNYHSVDIQWGNHDIVWMGAASGQYACIANVIRMSIKHGTLNVLEEGYGINLMPLASFAMKEYENIDCQAFSINSTELYGVEGIESKIYKAITMIQFKLEGLLILKNPSFDMEDRLLLDKINYQEKTILINNVKYNLSDVEFPTVNKDSPYRLTLEEEQVMGRLKQGFLHSEKLQTHVRFLFSQGGLYKIYNSNLLYHGCVPLDSNGAFAKVNLFGEEFSGKRLFKKLEFYARKGYFSKEGTDEREKGKDILWYLWTGPKSPLFGKDKMSTFERIFIKETETHEEIKNSYYTYLDHPCFIENILEEFGLDKEISHIINGHVPIEVRKGENPVKCGGSLIIIDGGFSKAYHQKTGIAGYTLVSNSRGIRLVEHETFESAEISIRDETDIISDSFYFKPFPKRRNVGDTDVGIEIKETIHDLEELLSAYKSNSLCS